MISIIGMACEFAGPADSLDNFWQVILNGVDATSKIDSNRWKTDLSRLPESILHGGYLRRDPWGFDNQFFGISPKEAARMDPQHRLLLELTYHALEDANINPDTLKGKNCGVFIGLGTQDYARIMHSSEDFPGLHSKGSLGSMAAGRISYHFDFVGPTFVVDTACSSSLVALHQAIIALQRCECNIAVVGGITQILTIDYSLDLSNANMMAQDGRCKAFSKYADGFARGEGAGIIILERQEDSTQNNRRVYANLLGSAINGDGRSNGITAPSQEAQQRLIEVALQNANLKPEDITYIEAHGTGTNLGDKIEFAALSHVFGERQTPIYLGSVKANIAHCEAAAGIAGVIKASLCIYNKRLPPHRMADSIDDTFSRGPLPSIFLKEAIPHEKIIAGVSSFGMSGSNAHVLLGPSSSEIDHIGKNEESKQKIKQPFLFLSAKSPESLVKLSDAYCKLLNDSDEKTFKKALDQANLSRKHWPQFRLLAYGADKTEFLERLSNFSLQMAQACNTKSSSKIAFLFTGQGSIYKGMTKLLYDNVVLYQEIFDTYAANLDAIAGLKEKIKIAVFEEDTNVASSLGRTEIAQLSLFLVEYCLVEFLILLGVKPDYVVGHSLGEYAAACCAGILTFENAVRMIQIRSREMERVEIRSGMVQILASRQVTEALVEELNSTHLEKALWLSVYNAPKIHVVSGKLDAIDLLIERLKQLGIPYFKLKTTHGFHTPLFKTAALNFENSVNEKGVVFSQGNNSAIKFISTVSLQDDFSLIQNVHYWGTQIVEPVRFHQAIDACRERGVDCFVEIGPDSQLIPFVEQCLEKEKGQFDCASIVIKRNQSIHTLFRLLDCLYVRDRLDVSKLDLICNGGSKERLPSYPFIRTKLLPDYARKLTVPSEGINVEATHLEFEISLDLAHPQDHYLKEHVINGMCILPGSYYIETAIAIFEKAVAQKHGYVQVKNISIFEPVIFENIEKITIKVNLSRKSNKEYELTFFDLSDAEKPKSQLTLFLTETTQINREFPHFSASWQSVDPFYQQYAKCGVSYGSQFRMLKGYSRIDEESAIAEIEVQSSSNQTAFYTRFLDNCFQVIALCLNEVSTTYAPISIAGYQRHRDVSFDSMMKCYAQITKKTRDYLEANLTVYNSSHDAIIEITGIVCRPMNLKHFLYEVILEKMRDSPDFDTINDSCILIANDKTRLPEFFPQVPILSDKAGGASHLVYILDGLESGTESIFHTFRSFYEGLRKLDDQAPGQLKTVSIICLSNDSHSISLARSCALVFPTEFPTVLFRCFCYDSMTATNVMYLFDTKIAPNDELPFWYVKGDALYKYRTASLQPAVNELYMKKDGHYLVTGGLGGVGKHVIQHMIAVLGLKKIIVTIRNPQSLTLENKRFLEDLRTQYGVDVLCKPVNLSREEEIVQLFQELPRPLYGIFHLAGTNIDQSISKITPDSFQQVVATKLYGASELDKLSQTIDELEYFVLFSSMAALVSSPGQFSYAFANLGLQSIAERRAAKGLPATVISWGPWADIGMTAKISKDAKSSTALADFSALEPSVYCEILTEALVKEGVHHFAVFKRKDKVIRAQATVIESDKPDDLIKDTFLNILVQETGCERSKISMDSLLSDLGLDSINIIRIRAELQSKLSLSIPLSILLEGARIGLIINELRKLQSEYFPVTAQKVQSDSFYPLSYNQFSIWYEQQSIIDNFSYYCSIGWKISGGSISSKNCERVWASLLEQHDMLRAVLVEGESELGYRILPFSSAKEKALIYIEKLNDDVEIEQYLKILLKKKIDLYQELPTKVFLLQHRTETYLMIASHHIIMDAASIFYVGDLLLRAVCGSDREVLKNEISAPYHDFVAFQKQQSSEFCKKATQFLFSEVFDKDQQLRRFELPKNDTVNHKNLALGKSVHIQFSKDEMQTILSVPQNERVHLCLSAWALLLARYSGEREILVGIAFNGRTEKKWTETIGHFVNVLPLCISVDQNQSCLQYINAVKQHLFELLEFQDFPLAKLLVNDKVKHLLHGNPLLQTYFNYFDASQRSHDIDCSLFDIEPFIQPQQEAQFEISLWVVRNELEYLFDIKYRTALLSDETVQSLAEHYKQIILFLSRMLLDKEHQLKLKDMSLLSSSEEAKMLRIAEGSNTHEKFIYDYFDEQVSRSPQAIAIEKNETKISYQQLSAYIDELASAFMSACGACTVEETVAILVPEKANIEFIIVVFMLWKEGFAYLPLNTHHPIERIKHMMEVAGCKKILNVDADLSSALREYVLSLDDILTLDVELINTALRIDPFKRSMILDGKAQKQEQKLAYILFTSGSTGLPKGVLIEHNGLIDRLLWMKRYFNFSSQDKFLQSTVLTFDISVPEFCLPLITGGTCVLSYSEDSPAGYAEICNRHNVSMMSTVPSLFSILQNDLSTCRSLKHVILVGEVLPPIYVNKWLATNTTATLYNLYGPTEATIYATYYACNRPISSSCVPIGAPCDHVIPLVLDAYGNFVPKGVIGELYLAGEGVAREYIGYQQKSNPFTQNLFQQLYPRIYKTGDFVRWRDENTLEYVGRKDNRVKLHGLLIELGEIEQLVMQQFPDITNAAAIIVDFDSGQDVVKHIVLCLMPIRAHVDDIYAHLEAKLPKYMLPWKICTYAEFSRNSSNKIDRKALGQLVLKELTLASKVKEKAKPASQLGKACVQLWEKILQKEDIGIDENFFDLGGDSLLLTKMILMAERQLSIKINFTQLLQNPTINGILTGVAGHTNSWQIELQIGHDLPLFEYSRKNRGAIFLTGVTGHLGIHILHSLLKGSDSHIYVIVRGTTIEQAEARISSRYEQVFLIPLDLSRVHLYTGDLTLSKLGLHEQEYSSLCQEVSIIIHAAAEVNHALDYARLKTNNVIATKHIVEFANHCHCQHLFHISTQFTELNYLPETYLDHGLIDRFSSGYEQSKFMAEVLVEAAASNGYPISTLRLPLIIDGSDPHLLTQNHFVALVLKCLKLGSYPDTECAFDVLPTEQIAEFIAKKCLSVNLHPTVYNCSPSSIKLSELFEYLNEYANFEVAKIDFQSWRDQVLQATSVEDPFYRLLPLYTTGSSPLIFSQQHVVEKSIFADKNNINIQERFKDLMNKSLVRT